MGRFATGKHALGISDRSGFQYPLNQMRKEWNGLLVGRDEWEPKQPQLFPRRQIADSEAVKDARPDRVEPLEVFVGVPLVENQDLRRPIAIGSVGEVTVTT